MTILIIALHIFVCIALIMIVLLQTGKGADMGAAFGGGGSQTLFGTTGASTFLSKATTVAAVVFMVTCFLLAYMSSNRQAASIMENEKPAIEKTVPGQQAASETPVAPAPNGDKPEKAN